MKRLFALFLLAAGLTGTADAKCICHPCDQAFYIKLGSGVSFAESAHVSAPITAWNPALQGYNSKLGNTGIAELAIGCEYKQFLDLEVSFSDRSTFKYRKFQTPVDGGSSYTREFDLNVKTVLFSANILLRDFECLNWNIACGTVYPLIGAGVGVSNLAISNFRTTGLPPTGSSFPFPSFNAENQYTHHRNFTYTVQVGLEYNYSDAWAITTGYRYFDAGKFKGPHYLRTSTGGAVDLSGEQWKMRFRSNEWFIELSIFI